MIFNDFYFLFLFLPVVLIVFYIPSLNRFRPYCMIISSLVFYAFSGLEHAIILLLEAIWVYAITSINNFKEKSYLLVLAVIPLVFALVYYKYIGFFVSSFLDITSYQAIKEFDIFKNIILPAGISFFTFQLASYAVDCRRGDIKEKITFSHFAAYICFFPQLVAGPILRYRDISKGLHDIENFRIKENDIARAIGYIVLGLSLKVILADSLGHYINTFKADPSIISRFAALYTIVSYSFQIYFDFYGYSMIAIGLGCLFGLDFPHNFKRPYEAENPRVFWRRWHITLSFWIRDYLYIPIGGNNKYLRNMIIVMALCGLWHGAGWTFVVWGLYHACLVIGYHFTKVLWDKMNVIGQKVITFSFVSYGWLLFLFDFKNFKAINQTLWAGENLLRNEINLEMVLVLFISCVVCFLVPIERIAENRNKTLIGQAGNTLLLSSLFILTLVLMDRSEGFIYFRF